MARRDFGQYCGLARALELIGERWTLLIVRDLLANDRRFTDLLDGLPGIPTNVLSARLKELEAAGMVERRVAPTPHRGVLYSLTADGAALQPAVIALAMWGTKQLGPVREGEIITAPTLTIALRAVFNAAASTGVTATWELRAPGIVLHAIVADGQLTAADGPSPVAPDLVMTFAPDELPTYRVLMDLAGRGEVELVGPKKLLATFVRVFTPPESR